MSTEPKQAARVRHVVYLSQAAAGQPPDTFARICRRAREHNAANGLGGVLLYDGQRFAQWICGPDAAVVALMQRIAVDLRHEALSVLHDGPHPRHACTLVWRAGFTTGEVLPDFAARVAEPGADALDEFFGLLPEADLWPPTGAPAP